MKQGCICSPASFYGGCGAVRKGSSPKGRARERTEKKIIFLKKVLAYLSKIGYTICCCDIDSCEA